MMRKASLFAVALSAAGVLAACSESSSDGALMEALGEQQDVAEEEGSVIIDFGEVYPDHDEFIVVCQEAFLGMALEHAGLPVDSVEPFAESESAVLAYNSGEPDNVVADVIDKSDVTLCDGAQDSAVPLIQNQQPFSYSELHATDRGASWLRTGTDPSLY